jgi:hypothetical protein
MARKTTGTKTANRRKKAEVLVPPAAVQVAPEVQKEVRKDVRKNGTPPNHVPVNLTSENIEDEIRRRAYELYLQRGNEHLGSQKEDWLLAEREIRSRRGGQKQLGVAAGGARA